MLASVIACGMVTFLQPRTQVWADPRSDALVIEVEKVVEKPIAVPLDCKTEKCKVLAYIVEVFGDDAADAITMINKCENHAFSQSAINYNKNGTTDHGIMQINSIHIPKCGEGIKDDYKANIDCGYKIFKNRGWEAWSCSHVVGVKSFWQ
jgi:hypothetical protein